MFVKMGRGPRGYDDWRMENRIWFLGQDDSRMEDRELVGGHEGLVWKT